LDYPSAWRVVTLTKKQLQVARTALAKTNPKLAKVMDEASAQAFGNNSKFYAVTLDDESGANLIDAVLDTVGPIERRLPNGS
jgi:hypothetical protein